MQSQKRILGQLLFALAISVGVAAASLEPVWGQVEKATKELAKESAGKTVRLVEVAAKDPADVPLMTSNLLAAAAASGLAQSYGLHLDVMAVCAPDQTKNKSDCRWEARATLRNGGDKRVLGQSSVVLLEGKGVPRKDAKEWSAGTFDVAPLHRMHYPRDSSVDDLIARLHQGASTLGQAAVTNADIPSDARAAIANLASVASNRDQLIAGFGDALDHMRVHPTHVLGSIVDGKHEARVLTLELLDTKTGAVAAKTIAKVGQTFPRTLPLFGGAAFFCIVGLLLWRRGLADEITALAASKGDGTGQHHDDPFDLLEKLIPSAKEMSAQINGFDTVQIMSKVDELLSTYVLPFAEVRTGVTDRLGMAAGAEVLVTVAYGERMLNRAWSAASDGHLPEAQACVPDAVDAFDHASDLAQAALKAQAGSN